MRRLRTTLVLIGLLGVAAPAGAYVLHADALVSMFHARRQKLKALTQRIEGVLTLIDDAGVRRVLPATRMVQFEGKCRLQVDEGGDEALSGGYVAIRKRDVVVPAQKLLHNLVLLERIACPLLSRRENAGTQLRRLFERWKVNKELTTFSRLGDRFVYVIGGAPWDEEVPQVWLDKHLFLPVRARVRMDDQWADVRLLGYTDPATGELHPLTMELWLDGKMRVRFSAERIENDVEFEPELFK